jgi:hypothetical protein
VISDLILETSRRTSSTGASFSDPSAAISFVPFL